MSFNRELQLRSFYDAISNDCIDSCEGKATRKDADYADQLRLEGEDLMSKDRLYINAIDKFNESLCYAPSKNLSRIYAKRADALLRMNLPKECMSSIALAEAGDSDCPEDVREMILKITTQCQERMPSVGQEEFQSLLELSYPGFDKLPFIANCLELQTSEHFGRYIVTNQDLKVGDVVMIERPFVAYLRSAMRYKRCAFCLTGSKRHTLIPCPSCCKSLYCTEECLHKAWDKYHSLECQVSDHLDDVDATEHIGRALRSLFVGVSLYGGLRKYLSYVHEHRESKLTAFDLDYTKRDEKQEFLVLHRMHFQDNHIRDRRFFMGMVAKWTKLLVQENVFGKDISGDLVTFLLNTIYRYTITSILNSYGSYFEKKPVASTQHLTTTMFNHSCAPNVQRIEQNGAKVLMVIRPVVKGSQLFDKYGLGFEDHPKQARQDYYQNQYGFTCTCVACVEDYPQINRPSGEQVNCPFGGSVKEILNFMQLSDGQYPCLALSEALSKLTTVYKTMLDGEMWEIKYKEFYKDEDE